MADLKQSSGAANFFYLLGDKHRDSHMGPFYVTNIEEFPGDAKKFF